MIRANFMSSKGSWQARPADSVVLDYEERHRRRVVMKGVRGLEFLLDLPEATHLRGGDALVLEDGRLVEIVAAPEPLAEARCADPRMLARVAYHVGNRHAPAEILANRIRIRRDHVLEDMVRGLGAKIAHIEAPFEPDGGAYEAPAATTASSHGHAHHGHAHHGHAHHGHAHHGHGHGGHEHHDHACGDDCAHDHGHKHDHKHDHGHRHDHAPGHDHDHKHDHAAHRHDHGHHDHGKHDHGKHDHGHHDHGKRDG